MIIFTGPESSLVSEESGTKYLGSSPDIHYNGMPKLDKEHIYNKLSWPCWG